MKPPIPKSTALTAPAPAAASRQRILFVCHEASRTGAPMFLLHFLRWLRANTEQRFDLLLAKGGPLQADFAQLAVLHEPQVFLGNPALLAGYDLIYANTACNTDLLDAIGTGGMPVVTHVHELDLGFDWLGARRMAQLMRQTHHFIACADAVAQRLRQVYHIPAERISRHFEMIDAELVRANARSTAAAVLRGQYDIPEDAQVLVGCGTCDLRKAPDLFVQLAGLVKRLRGAGRPLRFLWIGAQPSPELMRLLAADRRKLGLESELQFIAELPSPHALLALGDIFCLTSREDPFPLVMLEAAALGKPVVCFAGAGGGAEFCATGGGTAVPYLDVGAMAAACAGLLADPARSREIGRRGEAAVDARFNVGVVAAGLWQTVQALPATSTSLAPASATLAEIYAGWNQIEAPQRLYRLAHLARDESRRRARRLMQSGQRKEAAQLLVRAINVDLAARDVWTICESLCDISSDLAALDPRQSELLLKRAIGLAREHNLNIDPLLPRKPSTVAAAA